MLSTLQEIKKSIPSVTKEQVDRAIEAVWLLPDGKPYIEVCPLSGVGLQSVGQRDGELYGNVYIYRHVHYVNRIGLDDRTPNYANFNMEIDSKGIVSISSRNSGLDDRNDGFGQAEKFLIDALFPIYKDILIALMVRFLGEPLPQRLKDELVKNGIITLGTEQQCDPDNNGVSRLQTSFW